jgi:phosphotriesterase-related protein
VRDLTVGVADTGVRAGIVGAVGTDGNPLTANEVKVIRASAQASRLTGAALSVHTGAARGINEQSGILDLLQAEGADLNRVIIGQCDYLANDLPILERLLDRGAYVQFDGLSEFSPMLRRPVTDAHVARGIVQLIKKGYLKRILLSQGVDGKIALKAYGGRGYSSVLELFVPHLKRLGVTADQIETILIGNPKTVLTFVSARPQR